MFSLWELESICVDDVRLRVFLQQYGVLKDVKKCSCGGSLGAPSQVGLTSYQRCALCKKKIYAKCNSILEGSKLSLKQWVYMAYFWAHDAAGQRSVHMLGLSSATVADWSARFRLCVSNWEASHSDSLPFGGKDVEAEADECEIGHHQDFYMPPPPRTVY